MPKAMLTFDLPEDRVEHEVAVHAMDWALVAWDMDEQLRSWLKYGHEFGGSEDALEGIRQKLRELMEEHGVSLDMLA